MRRQLGVGLLTKIAKNGGLTNSLLPKSASPSPFLKPDSSQFHHRRSFSESSTLSRSSLWKLCSSNGVREAIRNGGFPSSLLARRVFSSALLQGRSKFPVAMRDRRLFSSFSLDQRRRRGSFFRRFTADGVVLGLIATNVAVFILWKVADNSFMVKNFMISVDHILSGRLHTLITNAFSHRDAVHLFSNMIGLYFFGTSIAQTFGPQYLLKLYLAGALTGSIFYLVYQAFIAPSIYRDDLRGVSHSRVPALGASAATSAIMLLDIFLYPKRIIFLDLIFPVPAFLVGVFIVGKDILRVLQGDLEVAGSAHLGGAAVATVAWLQKRKGRFGRF
ncbi:RHOMBOID-like protein 12, mitochondrial [Salvia splendens]|uniref:RHOMBOID-like protein 12, mitochondrial n=1 Tax=Salvia splendens TaxID=180675 RepID=UPI001C25923F|nr:RHOMBOID-like protein 12, mitochondrial [Salvia splendens]